MAEREANLNARDARWIESMRGKKIVPPTLRIDVVRPAMEPMLWLPDIVAGAVGQERVRNMSEHVEPLRWAITEVDIPLR